MLNLIAFLVLAAASLWDAPVTPQGVGPIRVGMSIAALQRIGAVRQPLSPEMEAADIYCFSWRVPGRPGVVAMMTGGVVVRIEVDNPAYRTRSGVRVGMAEAEVRTRLGAGMRAEPTPRGGGGQYLTLRARGSPYGMMVKTSGERAVRMRVGLWPHLRYEGTCF